MRDPDFKKLIADFVGSVGEDDVYNEFSLQHELGIFLRDRLQGLKVQFEKNVREFTRPDQTFEKKEIDIAIRNLASGDRVGAIELKFPRNGQVPESLFSFCKDIAFLEQLTAAGFRNAYFLALADHRYSEPATDRDIDIYAFFRARRPITGAIRKPTGAKDQHVTIAGSYVASWVPVPGIRDTRYCLVEVTG